MDAPADTVAGNCSSPTCDNGMVVEAVNEMDTPAEDIDGDCLAPACSMGGGQEIDDTDLPTSGCGGCANGVVIPWAEIGMACYTGDVGTQNVGSSGCRHDPRSNSAKHGATSSTGMSANCPVTPARK